MQLTIFDILEEMSYHDVKRDDFTENDKSIILEKVQEKINNNELEVEVEDLWNVQVFKNAYDFIVWLYDDVINGHVEIYRREENRNKTIEEIEKLEVENDERCTWLDNEKVLFINY